MVHMKQEAIRRKRRVATGGMQTVRSGDASARLDTVFAQMAKGGGLDDEDYLTDDEQLDVMPGYPVVAVVWHVGVCCHKLLSPVIYDCHQVLFLSSQDDACYCHLLVV